MENKVNSSAHNSIGAIPLNAKYGKQNTIKRPIKLTKNSTERDPNTELRNSRKILRSGNSLKEPVGVMINPNE